MTDTIPRQAAIEAIESLISGYLDRDGHTHDAAIAMALAAINALPSQPQTDALKCEYCGNTGICGWDKDPQFCGQCDCGMAALTGWTEARKLNRLTQTDALKIAREAELLAELRAALEARGMEIREKD
jgi:hypothetical protein